jgi:hypothetical protein
MLGSSHANRSSQSQPKIETYSSGIQGARHIHFFTSFSSFMLTKLKFFFFFFFSSPLLPPIYLHQLALAIVPHPCTILPKGKDEF